MTLARSRRVLIIGWDALRPDLINPENTPVLHRMAKQGVQALYHYAAYPTETRVNAASLSTGCWPGRHGLVGNEFYVRGHGYVNSGNHRSLFALRDAGHPTHLVPSLAHHLQRYGLASAVVSAGTPGATLQWDPEMLGPVLNVWEDFGDPRTQAIRDALGPHQPPQIPNTPANEYAVRVLLEHYLPQADISVLVLWCTEPDHSQHHRGLGSPEASQALRDNDALLGEVLEALRRLGEDDRTDVVLVSDHGFATVRDSRELHQVIRDEGTLSGMEDSIECVASYGIYLRPGTPVGRVAERLRRAAWCGAVLAREPQPGDGLLPLAEAWGGRLNYRSPDLIVSPAWDDEPNQYGIRGHSAFSSHVGNHGTVSPRDLHSVLVARGPSFRSGLSSETPAGACDLLPTVLHLLGLPPADRGSLDGRVLVELLSEGPAEPMQAREVAVSAGEGSGRQELRLRRVNGTQYLIGGWTAANLAR